MRSKFLQLPEELLGSFTYVDCGSQGDVSNPLLHCFPNSRFIGFDPGLSESTGGNGSSIYFPVAVGETSARMQFHKTQNPNCSSSYVPNQEFLDRFQTIGPFFNVLEVQDLDVVALDNYLPQHGVMDVDFVELDTQGSELNILRGARNIIANHVLGVRVEVEFSPMYQDQPLFADVDHFLRECGFTLFDIARYHLKRKNQDHRVYGEEQVVWGQALYLKDPDRMQPNGLTARQKMLKLAVTASHYGFHSYTVELIERLLGQPGTFSQAEKVKIDQAFASYLGALQDRFPLSLLRWLMRTPLRKAIRSWFSWIEKGLGAHRRITREQNYFWKD